MGSLVIDVGIQICLVGIFEFEQNQSFSTAYWVQQLYLYANMSLLLICIIQINAALN